MIEKLNLLSNIPIDKENEKFFKILENETIKIEKIVSNGQKSPEDFWYDQEKNEFVLLIKGEAVLEIQEDNKIKSINLKEGDCLELKAHQKHRVSYTSESEPTIWLAIFY